MRWPSWLLWPLVGFLTPMVFVFAPSPGAKLVASPTEQAVWVSTPSTQAAALRRTQAGQLAQIEALAAERRQLLADLESIADLVPEQYRMLVLDVARHEGLEPRVLASVGWVESRWDPQAAGSSGEIGIMQIMAGTADWIADQMGLETYDLIDPATNVAMGARYLRLLIDEHGSVEEALAIYNAGPAYRTRAPQAARGYVDRVRAAQAAQ